MTSKGQAGAVRLADAVNQGLFGKVTRELGETSCFRSVKQAIRWNHFLMKLTRTTDSVGV